MTWQDRKIGNPSMKSGSKKELKPRHKESMKAINLSDFDFKLYVESLIHDYNYESQKTAYDWSVEVAKHHGKTLPKEFHYDSSDGPLKKYLGQKSAEDHLRYFYPLTVKQAKSILESMSIDDKIPYNPTWGYVQSGTGIQKSIIGQSVLYNIRAMHMATKHFLEAKQ